MKSTKIFHLVYFDYNGSLYVHFYDCNLRCLGCLRLRSIWDCHLQQDLILRLSFNGFLSLDEFRNIVVKLSTKRGLKQVVLGGGEPTNDDSLVHILDLLKDLDLEVVILTNAYSIDDELLKKLIDEKVTVKVSIKSIDPEKYEFYTGFPLDPVIGNFVKMYESGVKLVVETIVIPEFNDSKDIGRLAKFVSEIDRTIPLIIDSYVPIDGTPWRRPTVEELEEAEKEASKYLDTVYLRGKSIQTGLKGNVYLIYP
mgnify:CR=1 FL=1